ncbi:MAG: LysR family transcriptional regulator [Polynucleobacter sp. 17-46-58]|jgi:LysR family transcriptional activator of nhaA|nr:MAG: LysR family transcriptional regulator [Polynucleobacter sp. 35-46-207]OYZ38966.1 MAG: LysR family transcriptional regulator [Polynucleobacter sp. 16-46-70]OZA41854.1 MAG: LysR family transcriptional regulator [Polynucleobacter sp. 17-46-58]OZB42286.1 MAG: LysR family transcriptional regulator [Polynucleobacter sp. 39-45-136]
MLYNYRHLYYFWVVAKEGSMSKAAERLNMAIQTISAQVHELEKSLGYLLFKPAGRGIALTESGFTALEIADQIFSLGEKLPELLRDAASSPKSKITIGISDGLSKLVTRRLLDPIFQKQDIQLVAHEGEFEDLLAELALHRLDIVLADRPAPNNKNLNVYSEELIRSSIAWYIPHQLIKQIQHGFPECLNHIPVLLPTSHSTVRLSIDQWFMKNRVSPNIIGEFEDSALLKTFAVSGLGVFPAGKIIQKELEDTYAMKVLGDCVDIFEYFYAIRSEKKIQNPLVEAIIRG